MFHNLIEIRNKKKIPLLWSFICMVLCCTLLIGTSYAWFSDAVTSGTNRIQAGSLKVGLSYKTYVLKEGSTVESKSWTDASSTADVLNNAHYEPGFVSLTFFKIENKGDLSLKYQLALLKASEKEGTNVLGETFKLSDYLTFDFIPLTDNTAITKDEVENDTVAHFTRAKALALLGNKDPRSGVDFPYTVENTMLASNNDKEHIVALVTTMPSDVGAAAMYDDAQTAPELKLDFKLGATQWNGESDTFGNDYDEKAIYQADWSQSAFAHGQPASELKVYENGTEFVTVTGSSTEMHTLIVSECNAPVGMTIQSGKTYKSYNITLLDSKGKPVSGNDDYTVKIYVGKYLSNVALYHNGKPTSADTSFTFDPADYHADTGYLTFKTKKFSVFTAVGEGAVARIGEDKVYPSIEAAFDAVHSGTVDKNSVITVMAKETEATAPLTIKADENITLDLNGCTVKADVNNTITNRGQYIIDDSSSIGDGRLEVTGTIENVSWFIRNEGRVDLKRGAVSVDASTSNDSSYRFIHNEGQVDINGAGINVCVNYGNTATTDQSVRAVYSTKGTINMQSGSVSVYTDKAIACGMSVGKADGLVFSGGRLTVCSDFAGGSSGNVAVGVELTNSASASFSNAFIDVVSSSSMAKKPAVGILKQCSGNVQITNMTVNVVSSSPNQSAPAIAVQNNSQGGQCIINNGHFAGSGSVISNNNGSMTVDGGEYEILSPLKDTYIFRAGGVPNTQNPLVIKNAILRGESADKYAVHGVRVDGGGATVTISDSKIDVSTVNNKARGITLVKGTVSAIKNCIITVKAQTGHEFDAFGVALEKDAGNVGSIENCTINVVSVKNKPSGIYAIVGTAGKVCINGGNIITVKSEAGKAAFALYDANVAGGHIVDANGNTIENESGTGTCTWSGVAPTTTPQP